MVNRLWTSTIVAVALGCACTCEEHETAVCYDRVAGPIVGFDITVGTGSDGSDADIFFCVERHSNPTPACAEIESYGDDFMEGEVETYAIEFWLEDGDLARWWIENRGGAFGLIRSDNDWELASIAVDAVVRVGDSEEAYRIYEESEICADTLEAGDRWEPMGCE